MGLRTAGFLEFLRDELILEVQAVEERPWNDVAACCVELVRKSATEERPSCRRAILVRICQPAVLELVSRVDTPVKMQADNAHMPSSMTPSSLASEFMNGVL